MSKLLGDGFNPMDNFYMGFREVTPDQFFPEKWREFTVNIGGTQALQEIKVPERAGGYAYQDQVKLYTRNRFLYWRVSQDVLELVEHSLDVNLVGNALRYRFQDMPVLEGVSVHETDCAVIILVATVSSVHRLTFPHPDTICSEATADFAVVHHPDIGIKSIFADAKLLEARDPTTFYVINNMATNASLPHISASLLTVEEDSLFALAYATGGILLLRMSADTGEVTVKEVKEDSYVPRFLSGITNVLMRGRGSSSQEAVSLVLHCIGLETFLFCLYRDGCLAMWSCGRVACVCSLDLPQSTGCEPGRYATEGVQSHMLRKANDSRDHQLLLAVYLCFAANSEIVLVKPVHQPGVSFKLDHLRTIQTPANDLVEMALSSRCLWGVWRGPRGVTQVSRTVLGADCAGWQMAHLEPPPDVEAVLHPDMEVTDQFLSYIFDSGRFSMAVISRALSLFRRSSMRPETAPSYKKLLDRVSQAVGEEIGAMVENNEELTDEELLEVQSQCLLRFYSDCVQYNESSTRPVGLVLIGESGIALIKRQQYSLLRPMDTLEHLLLCSSEEVPNPGPFEDALSPELVSLMAAVSMLEERTSPEMKVHFELELGKLCSPEEIIVQLLHEDPTLESEALLEPTFLQHVGQYLQMVGNVYDAMTQLIQMLTLSVTPADEDSIQHSIAHPPKLPPVLACLFGSNMGSSVVTQSLNQMVAVRFSVCRNLLVLQHLLLEFRQVLGVCPERVQLDSMRSMLVPRIVVLTQAFYSISWLGTTMVPLPSARKAEITAGQLAVLGLARYVPSRPVTSWPQERRPQSLLALLIQCIRSAPARALLDTLNLNEEELSLWPCAMVRYVMLLGKLVWPICNWLVVPQLLLTLSQYHLVQEYVRLLTGWCEWNSYLRLFMMGAALLYSNEPHKALIVLQLAAKKDAAQALLQHLHGKQTESQSESILIQYYLLLIEMFRQLQHWNCVLKLAQTAVVHATNELELSKLHVIAFNTHLQQGDHTEAFNSLAAIGEEECSRLCLHQLVVTMFERRLLEPLMNFPQQSMFEALEEVVLSRARAADLQQSYYYNFLYSFHMKQGNVRKAAVAMVEQGLRLGQELDPTLDIVKRQAQCYLAGLNALRLAAPNYAWILKPKINPTPSVDENGSEEDMPAQSPKRRVEGAEIFEMNVRECVEILEVTDIKREYDLVSARLALIKLDPDYFTSIVTHITAAEVVTACTNAGLYEVALSLAKQFSIPLPPILAQLAHACVDMTKLGKTNAEETWAWLKENDVWEFGIGDANALDLSWKLLEVLIHRYEEPHQSSLHKAVTQTLLRAGFFLPHWLMASYRRINASELLRVYIGAGRLEEAASLAKQMVWATLGRCKEEFGLTTSLTPGAPYAYVPLHTIDWLVLELLAAAERSPELYSELLEEVEEMRHMYKTEAIQVTEQIIFRSKAVVKRL